MSLSILNNIAAIYAQNNLNTTQSNLQTTLQQLSSGSRINSGADDPAGLSVSDGLGANEAALTQSATNATEGIGMLQTADGALSQVTSLLDQALTIATEIGGGTLTSSQVGSANQEYTNILNQINDIGSHTNYNTNQVFSSDATSINVTDGTLNGTNNYTDTVGALTTSTVGTTAGAAPNPSAVVSSSSGDSVTLSVSSGNTISGTLDITGNTNAYSTVITPGTSMAQLASTLVGDSAFSGAGYSITALSATSITITGSATLSTAGSTNFDQVASSSAPGAGTNLASQYSTLTSGNATAAAQQITDAISTVAYQRGSLGADINQLTSAANVASAEQVNLTSAQNSISATDYGQAASNLSKYQILSQTGISALAQVNSVQQEVLKLLQ
jgi:flagellin